MQEVKIKHSFNKGDVVFVVRKAGVFKGKVTGMDWSYIDNDNNKVAGLYMEYTLDIISSGSLLAQYDKEINGITEDVMFGTKKEAVDYIKETIDTVKALREEADKLDDSADALEESIGVEKKIELITSFDTMRFGSFKSL